MGYDELIEKATVKTALVSSITFHDVSYESLGGEDCNLGSQGDVDPMRTCDSKP